MLKITGGGGWRVMAREDYLELISLPGWNAAVLAAGLRFQG